MFGATVSGRPANLPGADAITGIFINTLPVRVQVDDGCAAAEWLQKLQSAQAEARRYAAVSLAEVQAWTDVPGGVTQVDSIVVFENYPINDNAAAAHRLRLRDLNAVETTNYALSIVASPGPRLRLDVGYDPALFDTATVERIAGHLSHTLDVIAAGHTRSLTDIDVLSQAERRRVLGEWNDTTRVGAPATLGELFEARGPAAPDARAGRFA